VSYEYTLNSIKVVDESIDKINTKLALVITLSGVLVNFGKDLPGYSTIICEKLNYPCPACYFIKLIAYVFIVIAIT
jgi:hypothetical protein